MAEQTTNYIEIDGEGKYIEDTEAREGVAQNAADIETINAAIAKIGTYLESKTDGSVQISSTDTTVQEITLSKGVWVLRGQITNTVLSDAKLTSLSFSPTPNSWNPSIYAATSNPFVSQAQEITGIVKVTADTQKYYLCAYAPGAAVERRYIYAVKIA